MNFSLNEEQRGWQMEARKFAEEEIRPISLGRDEISDPRATFDWELIKKGSRVGFRTLAVSRKWGGHGADLVTQALVMTELARADSAISKTFSQNWKWSQLIAASCTEDQQERFLKPFLADDTYLLGSGSTEPNAGSDNRLPPKDDIKAGVQVRAERQGDEWILNGEKCFIANGSVAKLFFVRTRTNPNVGVKDGSTLFLVSKDTPGFRIGKVFNKRGWRFYQNAELIFENARVPHANLVGQVNGAAKARESDLSEFGDLELAANALGICDASVEMAMQYARTRRNGKPLGEYQLVQLKLSEMHMLTEALRSFVMRTAWERDQAVRGDKGLRDSPNAGLVMNYSQPVVQRVTGLNMEIHGPEGAMMNGGVDKLVRDAMIWTHLAGDSVQRMRSLRHLLH
ncbi:MAG: acyl-CoA/acyl-ACP dehydrogenase [Betaproteobacteria bacterium]|nr:acyl-CoA/acyl-ACP dehydrogenase [Betaproteobacteria bacterium]